MVTLHQNIGNKIFNISILNISPVVVTNYVCFVLKKTGNINNCKFNPYILSITCSYKTLMFVDYNIKVKFRILRPYEQERSYLIWPSVYSLSYDKIEITRKDVGDKVTTFQTLFSSLLSYSVLL